MRNVFLASIPAACLLFLAEISVGSEPVFLRDFKEAQRKGEGILLFIAGNGRLVSDSGPTSEESLEATFKAWRASGTEPAIRLVLFPALESNSDLKFVRRIIDFLRANRVGYDIMLESLEAVPDKDLQ